MIKYSILIPAYKAKYLKESIESILCQTYDNLELIIVNDASPEDIDGVVANFNDARIKYYINPSNCGAVNVVDNWNICLSYSCGEYVICMGDDDKLLPHSLETYNELIEKYPHLNIYHGLTEIINENSTLIDMQESRPEYERIYSMMWQRWSGRRQFIGDFLFRSSPLKDMGGFYKLPLAWGSDDITAYKAIGLNGIANTQLPVFQYRINSQTISSSGNCLLKIQSLQLEKQWITRFIESTKPSTREEQNYLNLIRQSIDKHYYKRRYNYLRKSLITDSLLEKIRWFSYSDKIQIEKRIILKAIISAYIHSIHN